MSEELKKLRETLIGCKKRNLEIMGEIFEAEQELESLKEVLASQTEYMNKVIKEIEIIKKNERM